MRRWLFGLALALGLVALPLWAADKDGRAEKLEALLPERPLTRKDAQRRLRDLLLSDIYTDAPEYADRVDEIRELIPLALEGKR